MSSKFRVTTRRSTAASSPSFKQPSSVPPSRDSGEVKVHGRFVNTPFQRASLFLQRPRNALRLCLGLLGVSVFATIGTNLDKPLAAKLRKSSSWNEPRVLYSTLLHLPTTISKVSGAQVMTDAGFLAKPRSMGYYFQDVETSVPLGFERLDPNLQRRLTHNSVPVSLRAIEAQRELTNSRDYRHGRADPLEKGDCKAQYEWQKASYPVCNLLHEYALTNLKAPSKKDEQVRLVANGYWRDIWMVRDYRQHKFALKTIRYEHDVEERNFDRHRRDAMAMERLTGSSNVVSIFGYCGNSGIFEFAGDGSLEDAIWYAETELSTSDSLIAAYQVAAALSDVHNVDQEGRASIAHADITPSQYVMVEGEGKFKLNDFNRARFITWNEKLDEPCGFYVGNNPGTFRAPEEYAYEAETEKIDVYSMGNIFYGLLTGEWPFEHAKDKMAQRRIMDGERPPISGTIRASQDPFIQTLLNATEMCWIQDPKERATARSVEQYLGSALERLGVPENDPQ